MELPYRYIPATSGNGLECVTLTHRQRPQVEVAEFSRNLKLLAKELAVPVVAVSQLNRGPEQRSDKRPTLADLRESGAIEHDSDLVILLHRPDAYEPDSDRAGEADLIVAKQRNGPAPRVVTVASRLAWASFAPLARHDGLWGR